MLHKIPSWADVYGPPQSREAQQAARNQITQARKDMNTQSIPKGWEGWVLDGVLRAMPKDDPRRAAILQSGVNGGEIDVSKLYE
jgi:hypothetical protein